MEATGEEPSYSIINLINHFIVYRERWELVEGNALKGPSWIVILPISTSSLQKKKENGGRTPPLSLPVFSVQGDSPGKNTRVECHALLQGIFPT